MQDISYASSTTPSRRTPVNPISDAAVKVPQDAERRVLAAAADAGLGMPAGQIVLAGEKKALTALCVVALGVFPLVVVVGGLSSEGIPDSGSEWFGLILFAVLGPMIVYKGLQDLVHSVRDRGRVYLFEHGLAAVDSRRRLRVFAWRTIRVESEITELKQYSWEKTPYHKSHVYTLIGPDGESLRLDSAMCKDVITLGPRIRAAANFEQGR